MTPHTKLGLGPTVKLLLAFHTRWTLSLYHAKVRGFTN